MPRSRNIKPGFFKNEDLAECSAWARLCFVGLWLLADREGRLEDRPKRIKAELFAFDSIEVDPLLDELARYDFLLRYRNDEGAFIQIVKFTSHQTPHYSERPSVIKPPGLLESGPHDDPPTPGISPTAPAQLGEPAQQAEIQESGIRNQESGIRELRPPHDEGVTPGISKSDRENPKEKGQQEFEGVEHANGVEAYRVPPCPYTEIVAAFHKRLPMLPSIVVLEASRKGPLRTRWAEVCSAERFDRDAGLAWFDKFFRTVSRSAFLTGKTKAWKASFDWLIKPTNFAKVVEGNYVDKP
jgi:hypothetical protein